MNILIDAFMECSISVGPLGSHLLPNKTVSISFFQSYLYCFSLQMCVKRQVTEMRELPGKHSILNMNIISNL